MFSVIQEDDGTFAFHLHVPPRQLDPERAREVLATLRPVLDELARACERATPPVAGFPRVLPASESARRARRAAERARSRYQATGEGTPLATSVAAAPDGSRKGPRRRAGRPAPGSARRGGDDGRREDS